MGFFNNLFSHKDLLTRNSFGKSVKKQFSSPLIKLIYTFSIWSSVTMTDLKCSHHN